MMSNGLQVSFPSFPRTHCSGSPRRSAFRLAGVRVRRAVASAKSNSVKVGMISTRLCQGAALESFGAGPERVNRVMAEDEKGAMVPATEEERGGSLRNLDHVDGFAIG